MKVFLGLINDASNGGELARSLTTRRNPSFVSADQEDENAERAESIFIWRSNRCQVLT